ncbi:HIT-like domain-containing protein [Daldinia vernicosa]|uniref:HIT-like domain-containing protein n=1 Tax=Daldinia vernicosa TaxID=114800 RepID=UPI0020078B66|nr:HIT-like domain-containing protein [Daldinia vernicosa]KAI0848555.1 HIT-like domain-containing protein [Daldinia vernicosa]
MKRIWSFIYYLVHLEWRERVQTYCIFCDRRRFEENIVYEDDDLIAINNIRKAGRYHWLVMPKLHSWRDIEKLEFEDAPLVDSMVELGEYLLEQNCPTIPPANVHIGFHRGRRVLFRGTYWPDIVSVHHLHMHVIVEPRFWLKLFKYPSWLPLMWKSEKQVMQELKGKSRKYSKSRMTDLLNRLLLYGSSSRAR